MEIKRVKHTGFDYYMLCYCVAGQSVDRWLCIKAYSTKTAAKNAISRIRNKEAKQHSIPLKFMIEWRPYPFCDPEDHIVVYEEV